MLKMSSQAVMNESLYHQLEFKSDYDKESFKSVFQLINSVDDAFNSIETRCVVASLISRLILLLRRDNTHFYDKTPSGDIKDPTEVVVAKSDLVQDVSDAQPSKAVEVKTDTNFDVDTLCKLDPLTSSLGGKRIFMLLSHEDYSDGSTLTGLATKLAQDVSSRIQTTNETAKSNSVADIVCHCIDLINNVKTSNKVLSSLSYIILKGEKSEKNMMSFVAQEDLRRILTIALKAILQDIKLSVEAIHDFEYVWEACTHKSFNASNIFQDQAIWNKAKECAWLLASTISLRRSFLAMSLNVSNQTPSECKRRERIILSAACVALIVRSTASYSSDVNTDQRCDNEPVMKLKCLDHRSPKRDDMTTGDKEKSRLEEKSQHVTPNQSQSRLSLENDAIAALSMMITGNSTRSPSDQHAKSSTLISHSAQSHYFSNDVIDTLTQTSNDLMPLTKITEKSRHTAIFRRDLENEIQAVETHFMELNLLNGNHKNDDFAVELSAQTTSKGSPKLSRDYQTHTGLTMKEGAINNIGGVKRKFNVIESYTSFLSTQDGLSSTNIRLGLSYQRLNKLLQEGHKTQDVFSYFGKFKFVNDMKLSSQCSMNITGNLMASNILGSLSGSAAQTSCRIKIYDRKENRLPQTHGNEKSRNICNSTIRSLDDSKSETAIAPDVISTDRFGSSACDIQLPQDDTIVQSMAVSDWTNRLLVSAMKSVQPSSKLNMYLYAISDSEREKLNKSGEWKDVLIPVLNNALCQVQKSRIQISGSKNVMNGQEDDCSVKVDEDGVLSPKHTVKFKTSTDSQHAETTNEVIGRALATFFYSSLEAILQNESARLKRVSHTKLVMNPSFHNALLSVCYICILSATGEFSKLNYDIDEDACGSLLNVRSVLGLMGCTAYEYLKVSDTFLRALGANSQDLPVFFITTLHETEESTLEALLWAQNGQTYESRRTIVGVIQQLTLAGDQGCHFRWPPGILESNSRQDVEKSARKSHIVPSKLVGLGELGPEYTYVTFLMKKVLNISSQRIAKICVSLLIPPTYPVASQIWSAFRHLLRNHIHLLYSRHVDQLILCTIFGVCKMMKLVPEITFTKIVEVYRDLSINSERIISHIALKDNSKKCQTTGNIIHLYNQVYVPTMKKYLLHNKSLEASSLILKRCKADEKESFLGKRPLDDATRLENSFHQQISGTNIFLKFSTGGDKTHNKPAGVHEWDAMEPKTRVLYNFSRGSAKVRLKNHRP